MRPKFLQIIIAGLFITIIANLVYIQIIQGPYYYNLSKNNRLRSIQLEGWRGKIKDRNGHILADNRLSYDVLIIPQDLKNPQELFGFLSKVLGEKISVLTSRFNSRRFAPFAPVLVVEDISRVQAMVLEEQKYRFPGLFVEEGFRRVYPQDKNSAHILGYVGKINIAQVEKMKEYGYSPQSVVGYSGVEEYYDQILRGEEGGLQVEVNSRGQQVQLLNLKESIRGSDITLTIDSDVQQSATELLDSRRGSIVVMDLDSGEILGMVSSPAYDPNIFQDAQRSSEISDLFANVDAPLLNRATKGLFPPGSVFKVVVALAGLESSKIAKSSHYNCPGSYELGGRVFKCTHVHGDEGLVESIAHSCNVFFYHAGLKIGADLIEYYAQLLGLGNLTNIDLPYERKGSVPNRREFLISEEGQHRWYPGDTLNFSIGQGGLLVTPIQLVKMMATIANDGIEVQPHLIKLIGDNAIEKYSVTKKIKVDQKSLNLIQQGLRATVKDPTGTAHILDESGLYVAGKTGTAQSFGNRDTHAWFVGYAKSEKRRIAFGVLLEFGGSSYNAVLVSKDLLERIRNLDIL